MTAIIRTFSGKNIDILNPDPELICIEDIAHALSFMPRFGGHTKTFYSVAEHSLYCSYKAVRMGLNKQDQVASLLHDASEAYLIDMPKPIKNNLEEYKLIENNLMMVIANKYDFLYPLSPNIHKIDKEAFDFEWERLIMTKNGYNHPFRLMNDVEEEFLKWFVYIINT